ncbi:MAG TPA: amino acid permease [Vicinamibacteria bacterium]|nr:amino acid permease [Vicinamibacteria bacterium]
MTTTPSGPDGPAVDEGRPRLRRTLRTGDGLAVVVGIMIGSGIFRTPGLVAAQLGRPELTFVVWVMGGVLALLGALVFAELSTRHPDAGGKYVYAREAFGPRAGFVVGWVEALGVYCTAIAALAVVCGEYLARLLGWPDASKHLLGALFVASCVALNLAGVAVGRWAQNLATSAKVLALSGVVAAAALAGDGAGWRATEAAGGAGTLGAVAIAFQAVIWTYYGYPDAAKIAEEMVDPGRTLPRVYLVAIALVTGLYLLLNAAFLYVLPFDRIAGSTLVAGDVMHALFGARAGALMSALALLVVAASVNGNVFVTPRVVFGLARDGMAPRVLARVGAAGTPWSAMILVGVVAAALAATGTFERLLSLAIVLVLLTDGFMVIVLFRLRARGDRAPFPVPAYPFVPAAFLVVYAALLAATAREQPWLVAGTLAALAIKWLLAGTVRFARQA